MNKQTETSLSLEGRFDDLWEMRRRFPEVETSNVSIARYVAAVNAAKEYAAEKELEVTSEDGENVYEQMCRRQIGNFAFAQRRTFTAKDGRKTAFKLIARLDANNRPGGYDGSWYLQLTSDHEELVERVKQAAANAKPLSPEEMSKAIKSFREGYQMCYGLCKRGI